MAADTGSCSLATMPPEHSSKKYEQMDVQIAALLRASILGDREALGDFCEAFRPSIYFRCRSYLQTLRLESHAEDLVQDVLLEVVKAFPRIDPYGGNLHALIKTITLTTLYGFLKRNRVMLGKVPLPDNDDAEKYEYRADPLDSLSREVWESDHPSKPPTMANRNTPRVIGRATREKMKLRAKEKELQLRPGSGNYRRDHRKMTVWDLKRIEKERMAWANSMELYPASGLPTRR